RMRLQVSLHIGAKRADVRHATRVHRILAFGDEFLVVLFQLGLLAIQIAIDQRETAQSLALFGSEEAHRRLIDIDRALDAPTARLEHPAPVLEALADEPPGWHGRDGLVPVLD